MAAHRDKRRGRGGMLVGPSNYIGDTCRYGYVRKGHDASLVSLVSMVAWREYTLERRALTGGQNALQRVQEDYRFVRDRLLPLIARHEVTHARLNYYFGSSQYCFRLCVGAEEDALKALRA